MKKGKTLLATLALGALTYLGYLAYDIKTPEKPAPITTPYEAVSETVAAAPVVAPAPAPAPRRALARRSVKYRKAVAAAQTEAAPAAVEAKKSPAEIPMPKGWNGHFENHQVRGQTPVCDTDRPCSPRGCDGVLLVGVAIALNGASPQAPQMLAVGSYQDRTPLLVYK